MIGRLRAGAKFFTIGLALGMLFAPSSGADLRERLRAQITGNLPGVRAGE